MNCRTMNRCWNIFYSNARSSSRMQATTIRQFDLFSYREVNTTSQGLTATPKLKEKPLREAVRPLSPLAGESESSFKQLAVDRADPRDPIPLPAVMEMQIHKSKSLQELLQISTCPTLLLKHACLILLRLGQLSVSDKSITFEELLKESRFVIMCNLVQRGDFSHSPYLLFSALHGLEKLGALESSDIFRTLNTELKWGLRRCQIKYLAKAVALVVPSGTRDFNKSMGYANDRRMEVLELTIETLQRRWVEVVSGAEFVSVFKIIHHLNDETRTKLEDRAVEMAPTFTPSEMRQIFITLADQKRRPTPLLRALSFHFSKSADTSNAKDLIELTYALNELTFADPILMEKICTNLCPEIQSIENPPLISALVTSLGQMRYKQKALMHVLDEWIVNKFSILRPFDRAAWIQTCAVLNHQSENVKNFCAKAKSLFSPETSSNHSEWVNIVHSLLVLNEHSDELMTSALSPEVVTSIDQLGVKSSKSRLKLLNINAMAKLQTKKGYKGPLLNSSTVSQWSASELKTSDAKLSGLAVETINSFMSSEKYLTLNQRLSCGVFVDAVCMLNQNMEPILKVSNLDAQKKQIRGTPVAIVIEGYSSMTLGSKEPTGQTLLNRKLLQEEGYNVLSLPYTEFNASEKLIRRAKYLEQKIKSIGKPKV